MACLMKQIQTQFFFFLSVLAGTVLFLAIPGIAHAAAEQVIGHAHPWQLNFQPASSTSMEKLAWLHHFLLYVIFIVSAVVTALLVSPLLAWFTDGRYYRAPRVDAHTHGTFGQGARLDGLPARAADVGTVGDETVQRGSHRGSSFLMRRPGIGPASAGTVSDRARAAGRRRGAAVWRPARPGPTTAPS